MRVRGTMHSKNDIMLLLLVGRGGRAAVDATGDAALRSVHMATVHSTELRSGCGSDADDVDNSNGSVLGDDAGVVAGAVSDVMYSTRWSAQRGKSARLLLLLPRLPSLMSCCAAATLLALEYKARRCATRTPTPVTL